MKKFKYLTAAVASLGFMFTTLQYPGGDILTILGFLGITIYCLISVFTK